MLSVIEIENIIRHKLDQGAWFLMETYKNSGDITDLAVAIFNAQNQQ